MNISNALGKWEKKFLEGLFGDEKDRTKTLALSSWPWLEFFKGRGGRGERIIPTRLPCCITRYFFSWIIVVHNLKKKKERKKNLSRRFGFRGYPWKPSLPPRYTPESHPLLLTVVSIISKGCYHLWYKSKSKHDL